MKTARRAFGAVAFLLASAAWSEVTVDFGGTLKNTTGMESAGTAGLLQSDRVTAWLGVEGRQTSFLLRGLYSLSYSGGEFSHYLDLDRLSLTTTVIGDGAPLSRFELSLGRRLVADHTGLVLEQNLDGIGITVSYPVATVSASLGTTFLPSRAAAPVVLSRADAADYAASGRLMGSPRAVGLIELTFPSVLRQRLTLSLAAQEDLRGLLVAAGLRDALLEEGTTVFDPSRGGLVDTQYASLGIRGNIAGGLFYDAFFTLNTGRTLSYVTPQGSSQARYLYTPMVAALGGARLTLYAEKALGSVAGLRFVLSSGDTWEERTSLIEGSLSPSPGLFLPVTAKPLSVVFAPTLGNLSFLEASYSIRPFTGRGSEALAKLQFGLSGLLFLRLVDGPISAAISDSSPTVYVGTEADLAVAFRPFSDLALEATGGVFLPSAELFTPAAPRWRAALAVSLSL